MTLLLYVPTQTAVGAAFLAGLFSCVAAGNTRTVLLNVNAPETRGTAFAIYSLLVLLRRPPLAITTAPVMAAVCKQRKSSPLCTTTS